MPSSRRGSTATEYALIAALVALVVVSGVGLLGTSLQDLYDDVALKVDAALP